MNSPMPPPPSGPQTPPPSYNSAPPAAPKRAKWPWFLGGCLILVLIIGAVVVGLGWFAVKQVSNTMTNAINNVPAVQENFGNVTDIGVDLGAISEAKKRGEKDIIYVTITGSKGKGRIVLKTDEATKRFSKVTLELPDGQTLDIDPTIIDKAIGGQLPR